MAPSDKKLSITFYPTNDKERPYCLLSSVHWVWLVVTNKAVGCLGHRFGSWQSVISKQFYIGRIFRRRVSANIQTNCIEKWKMYVCVKGLSFSAVTAVAVAAVVRLNFHCFIIHSSQSACSLFIFEFKLITLFVCVRYWTGKLRVRQICLLGFVLPMTCGGRAASSRLRQTPHSLTFQHWKSCNYMVEVSSPLIPHVKNQLLCGKGVTAKMSQFSLVCMKTKTFLRSYAWISSTRWRRWRLRWVR